MRAEDVLGRVTLVTGKEEFLGARTVEDVKAAVRAHDAESEFSDGNASDLTLASLGEMSAPSLFSAVRCVVVRGLENLPDESVDGVLAYAASPVEDVALVLVHGGGQKGSGVLTKLRKLGAVSEHRSEELKPSDFPGFVANEVRRYGASIDREAADVLIEAIGRDLRSLAGAAHQLTNDFPGERISEAQVRRYFGGRAEAKSFAVADAAFAGRDRVALEELRWALDAGTAAVLITSAFAGSARGLARMVSAPRGMRDVDLAREVGVPPWKLRSLRDQSRGWTDAGLARAIRAVAQADADVKGAASDASYALERLVLTITGLRQR
ncbi:DNA polymerase III subunit delta [Nocardioides sp. Root190]|uniref:DNA polymerase III subunit delta n=1 Tax=Nocardioides sp. Root190 TaxID=1736488 RepID=UPI0006FB93FF|nr:DNA polymerase III subunit delta [Nocardioides sp. Root190]KRB77341.1 DNA polymerase III subunit delta [Nocardioides sp. Root190]